MKKQFELPMIQSVGKASNLIQLKVGAQGDGGVAGHSKIQTPAAIEAVESE
jgi:hypothetical protein